jgi:hypothetical protein
LDIIVFSPLFPDDFPLISRWILAGFPLAGCDPAMDRQNVSKIRVRQMEAQHGKIGIF